MVAVRRVIYLGTSKEGRSQGVTFVHRPLSREESAPAGWSEWWR